MTVIRYHLPRFCFSIHARINLLRDAAANIQDAVGYHHEKWDGTGYPFGKSGNDIPLPAQIVSLISAYCALTEKRAFREAYDKEDALRIIEEEVGTEFNPDIYSICKKIARQLR